MTAGTVLIVAAEVLGCAVALYLLAAFLVSLRRLLPFLAIAAAVGTIFVIKFVNAHAEETGTFTDLLFLPIAMSLLMQLFFQADGYMNPRIHENLFRLVSVERKWESVFADDDEYVLHFSPVETGGFIENTVFQGILFFLFYYFVVFAYPNSTWGYVLPTYVIAMSVVDILAAFGLMLPDFIYRWVSLIVIIISVGIVGVVGTLKNRTSAWEINVNRSLYDRCAEFAVVDTSVSYRVTLERFNHDTYRSEIQYYYIYDADLDAAATYTLVESAPTEMTRQYRSVIAGSAYFGGERVMFENVGGSSPIFRFARYANTDDSGIMKYTYFTPSAPPEDSIFDYFAFTEEKFFDFYSVGGEKGESLYVQYHSEDYELNSRGYSITYTFATTEENDEIPVALISARCSIQWGNSFQTITYYPMNREDTELGALFDEQNQIREYTYNVSDVFNALSGGKSIPEYFFGENADERFSDALPELIAKSGLYNVANDEPDFAGGFDFKYVIDDNFDFYIYDAQSGTTARTIQIYLENSLARYEEAKAADPDYDKPPLYDLYLLFYLIQTDEGYISYDTYSYGMGIMKRTSDFNYTGDSHANRIENAFCNIDGIETASVDKENLEITFTVSSIGGVLPSRNFTLEYTFRYREAEGGGYEVYEYVFRYENPDIGSGTLTLFADETYDLSVNRELEEKYGDAYRP